MRGLRLVHGRTRKGITEQLCGRGTVGVKGGVDCGLETQPFLHFTVEGQPRGTQGLHTKTTTEVSSAWFPAYTTVLPQNTATAA
jgi:hypothetical protein